jgi:hypothetical protein
MGGRCKLRIGYLLIDKKERNGPGNSDGNQLKFAARKSIFIKNAGKGTQEAAIPLDRSASLG